MGGHHESSSEMQTKDFLPEKPKSSGIYLENYYESTVEPAQTDFSKQKSAFSLFP